MKGKKLLALIMTTALVGSVLVGCGNKTEPATSDNTKNNTSSGPVKIIYARGKDVTGANQKMVDKFNELHKGKIEVSYVEMPTDTGQSHDKYVTVFGSGGTDYDVFDGDVIWPAEFAEAGYALPLDNYIARDNVNLKDYMEGPIKSVTFKGKTWGLPKFIDAGLLFYRKDLAAKAPETWEDLISASKSLKGKTNFSYIGQFKQYEGLVCNAVEFISAYGGQVVDGDGNITIDSDGTRKGLEVMKSIVKSDFVPNNITNFTETESDNAMMAGQTVFLRNWPYQWAEVQDASKSKVVDKVAVAPLPKGSARSAACLGGWVAMINKNTKHPDEAWEFLKFMCGPEGQKITALYGGSAPTLTALYKDSEITAKYPLFGDQNFVNGLSAAVPRPVSPIYPKLSDIMQQEISKFIAGQQDVNTTVKNMDTKMKAAVADAKK